MAAVTKTPLYEDGEFVGVITVSSDAAVFNKINMKKLRMRQDVAHDQPREWKLNMKRIQWHPRPQIPSSVYNLVLMCYTKTLLLLVLFFYLFVYAKY